MNQKIVVSKGKRVFPNQPEDFVGKIVQDERCDYSVYIAQEVDDSVDLLNGVPFYNPRRNKFWGHKVSDSEWLCICIDWFLPDIIERIQFYEPIWSIVQTDTCEPTAGVRQETGDGQAHQDHATVTEEEEAHR